MRLIRSLLAALALFCLICGVLCGYAAYVSYSAHPPGYREVGGLAQVSIQKDSYERQRSKIALNKKNGFPLRESHFLLHAISFNDGIQGEGPQWGPL